jgi:hypothetical protein
MNSPLDPRPSRITPLRVALAAVLLCIATGTVLHHVRLNGLQKEINDAARVPRIAALENRVAELNAAVGELAKKPSFDPARHESDLKALETQQETARQDIAEHLATLELSFREGLALPDWTALEERIAALEIQISELSGLLPPPAATAPASPTAERGENDKRDETSGAEEQDEPPLPFEVVDVEVRGGAHFVVIGDGEKVSRILYPGDVEDGWRLDGVDERTAIFRHGETTRRVTLP